MHKLLMKNERPDITALKLDWTSDKDLRFTQPTMKNEKVRIQSQEP